MKRLILTALFCGACILSPPKPAEAKTEVCTAYLCGDLNGDHRVTASDALATLRYAVELEPRFDFICPVTLCSGKKCDSDSFLRVDEVLAGDDDPVCFFDKDGDSDSDSDSK
jgi:hypothetical protein